MPGSPVDATHWGTAQLHQLAGLESQRRRIQPIPRPAFGPLAGKADVLSDRQHHSATLIYGFVPAAPVTLPPA